MVRGRSPRRVGFTLIELLVVIAILALLAAITAAAVNRVRAGQMAKTTEQTVGKLQIAIDQQWKAVIDKCKQDQVQGKIPSAVVAICDGDLDRAASLWTYANLKRAFPQTFQEAKWSFVINGATVLQPRTTFGQVPNTNTGYPDGEAAALLYLILNEGANGGANSMTDDVTASAQMDLLVGSANFRVYKDAYGNMIPFVRFFQTTEINSAPFVNAKDPSKDPIDPRGKLYNQSGTWTAANQTAALVALNTAGPAVAFDATNKMITVISYGPNKTFENNPLGTTDDVYGYRLRRLGKQGD
ncbi:MAG: prepilin-type cleavage/methylation protein [Gemmataceae bacterium]|nr:prepilin-type cleavage/methylation protein [Gemmataceae bacterium]